MRNQPGDAKKKRPGSLFMTLVVLLITSLLGIRIYLMVYFPGTLQSRWLFDHFTPHWDLFARVTRALNLPGEAMSTAISFFLPANLKGLFPTAPAWQVMSWLNPVPGLSPSDYQILYPGQVEWMTLLAILAWWFLLLAFNFCFGFLFENRGQIWEGLISAIPDSEAKPKSSRVRLETRQSAEPSPKKQPRANRPASGKDRLTQFKPEAGNPAVETGPAAAAEQPKANRPASSGYKERLTQFKAEAADIPKVSRESIQRQELTPEMLEQLRQKEGDMMARHMIRELQKENMSLYSQQQSLRSTFSQYFSANVLAYLEENKHAFQQLENQKRNVSVLFCDIRGFSVYSQSASSEALMDYLDEYFNIASDVILRRFDGVISKMMGDGLMAYWGFPFPQDDHAYIATQAAIHILRGVELRNKTTSHSQPLNIGIGIASGEVLIGNVGSTDFKDFTLIGVPVNLASRLDEANKELNTSLLISANTFAGLKGRISCRDYGDLQLRNWQGTERVFGPKID